MSVLGCLLALVVSHTKPGELVPLNINKRGRKGERGGGFSFGLVFNLNEASQKLRINIPATTHCYRYTAGCLIGRLTHSAGLTVDCCSR